MDDDQGVVALADTVMRDVRALRQALLVAGPDPVRDRARSGLTGPQVALLTELVRTGTATVTELAGRLHLSHSTTSGIVDRLEARALVARTRDTRDRRVTQIVPTSAVTAYVQAIGRSPYRSLVEALEKASPQERAAVRDGLATLRAVLDRIG